MLASPYGRVPARAAEAVRGGTDTVRNYPAGGVAQRPMKGQRGREASFPRHVSPGFCILLALIEKPRAQGRPGGRCTRGSRAKIDCASAKTTGTGGDTPAFPARWFTAYIALSSVNHPVCHRRLALILRKAWRQISGAPGPHDFAVRTSAARQSAPSRPPHPASRVVTIAMRPSCRSRTKLRMLPIYRNCKCRELRQIGTTGNLRMSGTGWRSEVPACLKGLARWGTAGRICCH
jgi:hypothetical protein